MFQLKIQLIPLNLHCEWRENGLHHVSEVKILNFDDGHLHLVSKIFLHLLQLVLCRSSDGSVGDARDDLVNNLRETGVHLGHRLQHTSRATDQKDTPADIFMVYYVPRKKMLRN